MRKLMFLPAVFLTCLFSLALHRPLQIDFRSPVFRGWG